MSVRRDPENKRIYFNINGKEEWVSISGYAQSICYGYARLTSIGNDSEIEVTLIRGKAKEGICEITTFFNVWRNIMAITKVITSSCTLISALIALDVVLKITSAY